MDGCCITSESFLFSPAFRQQVAAQTISDVSNPSGLHHELLNIKERFLVKSFTSWIGARPYWVSLFIALILVLWMGSGYPYVPAPDEAAEQASEPSSQPKVTRVQARKFQAQPIEQSLDLYGRSEAYRQSVVGAEVSGRIIEWLAQPGAAVKKDQPLARLAANDRGAQLERAKALLEQREIEYEGAKALNRKGFQGKAALAQARSQLVDAQSAVKRLQLELKNTQILAPFDGIFSDNLAEVGDFLGVGDPILTFVDRSKLLIAADVSERDISHLKLGQNADVHLVTGESVTGTLNFIASVSNLATNTFRVEVLIDNPDAQMKAGVSAELHFPLGVRDAIKVTPAVLAIADDGTLGVKSVVQGHVVFHKTELLRSDSDGAWLGGFSGEVTVITLGQGFVREGDPVEVVWEK
jgi:multidrug efflux system membrane fusion protein